MRTYAQLNEGEREKAREQALTDLLRAVTEGVVRFNDKLNADTLQERIDAAQEKAEAMQTPWFAHEYIMESCGDDLRSMANCDVEDALYPDPSERIINI